MRIGLVQYSPEWENPEKNILRIGEMIKSLNSKVDLLIFPELSLTGFTMNSKYFAEDLDGVSTQYFIKLSQKLKTNIFAGIIEKSEDGIFNSLVHFNSDGLINARYRKIHPFGYANEDQNYRAGDENVITKIENSKFGLSICYDLRFPELYRLYAKERVHVLINIANWPVARIEHWRTLLKARAIENQCFMIGVNRVGNDPHLQYNGCSSVYDPMGNEIISIGDEENIFISELDPQLVEDVRNKLPFLDDIRLI
jgi:predicted amidohydrolase